MSVKILVMTPTISWALHNITFPLNCYWDKEDEAVYKQFVLQVNFEKSLEYKLKIKIKNGNFDLESQLLKM